MINRVLIVGFGSAGRRHVRIVRRALPRAHITVLRHNHCEDMDGAGIDSCVLSMDEALRGNPEAAVIANPASEHCRYAKPLAEQGVHLLMEKPLSSNLDGVRALVDTCRQKGTVLMVGYNLRFTPSMLAFRKALGERRMGRVLSLRVEVGQFLPSWRAGADYRSGVSAQAKLGGGVLLELSHELDYLRWLFGDAEWVSAIVARQSDLEIDVEDTALLTISLAGDGKKQILASVNLDFVRHDTTRTCTVVGDKGTLRWDGKRGTVELLQQGRDAFETLFNDPINADDSYVAQLTHFLAAVDGRATPSPSGEDGIRVLEMIEAARSSSLDGGRQTRC